MSDDGGELEGRTEENVADREGWEEKEVKDKEVDRGENIIGIISSRRFIAKSGKSWKPKYNVSS